MPIRRICLGVLLCTAALTQPAAAAVQPAGTGEPLYTNSAQNTQFFEWPATSGADEYKIRFDYYADNTLKANPSYAMSNGGTTWANWSGVAALQHGSQYGICAQGNFSWPNDPIFFPDGPNSCSMGTTIGRRAYTTIDRSKPTAAITLAGGAAYVRDAKIPLKVDFADDVAGPFPANFLCFQSGGGPGGLCDAGQGYVYGYNAPCSMPAGGGKATSFTCTADYGAGASPAPDGPVWACVRAADAAIPDNPSGSNQSGSAEKANLSDPSCDGVVLDRTPPAATVGTAATTVDVGQLVSFQAQATDATSGLGAQSDWSWGDNTAAGSGASATHTFTQAGTYDVRLTVADNAGNTGTATRAITVKAPDGGTTTPGGGTTTPGGGTTTPGGSTPKLTLSAPGKLSAKAKAVRVALTASAAGRVQLALVRAGRVVSRGGTAVKAGTTAYKLKLPKGTKAGRYAIKATYTPAGRAAKTSSRAITLTGKARAARASLASRPGGTVDGGPVGMPDGTFHGPRPARTFPVR